jgi:hypothetical protein
MRGIGLGATGLRTSLRTGRDIAGRHARHEPVEPIGQAVRHGWPARYVTPTALRGLKLPGMLAQAYGVAVMTVRKAIHRLAGRRDLIRLTHITGGASSAPPPGVQGLTIR